MESGYTATVGLTTRPTTKRSAASSYEEHDDVEQDQAAQKKPSHSPPPPVFRFPISIKDANLSDKYKQSSVCDRNEFIKVGART